MHIYYKCKVLLFHHLKYIHPEQQPPHRVEFRAPKSSRRQHQSSTEIPMCSNLLLHSSLHSFRTLQDQCSLSMETQLANHFTIYQEIPIHARNMYRILSKGHMQTFPHSHIQHLSPHSFMVETFCPHLSKYVQSLLY